MSYTIEYNKQVFYKEFDNQKIYFLFVRRGDNNVRDAYTNLRSKRWCLVTKGTEKELWKYIGGLLGSVEGGMIQKSKGWEETEWYTAEEYIKQYRSKIKNAKPLETMLETFDIEVNIYLREGVLEDNDNARMLKQLILKYGMKSNGTYFYDKSKKQYQNTITNSAMLDDFLVTMPTIHTDEYDINKAVTKRNKRLY